MISEQIKVGDLVILDNPGSWMHGMSGVVEQLNSFLYLSACVSFTGCSVPYWCSAEYLKPVSPEFMAHYLAS